MNLQIIVAFGVYFSILGIIGFFAYWKSRKSGDFALGRRSINYWVTAISVHASDMSDWLFMGYPALVFTTSRLMPVCAFTILQASSISKEQSNRFE